jgi:hypothetical protein
VEVCGSSPHGPTILFNNLRTWFPGLRGVCVVVCAITPGRTPAAERVEGAALGIEPDVAVMRERLGRDVTSN